jgi:hypothetical protein
MVPAAVHSAAVRVYIAGKHRLDADHEYPNRDEFYQTPDQEIVMRWIWKRYDKGDVFKNTQQFKGNAEKAAYWVLSLSSQLGVEKK